MAGTEAITELLGNFKNLVKKITYDKTEVDDKLSTKANNSLVSQSSNGLMSSADKVKLDGIATGANKTVIDSSLSAVSTNPVQNKIIHQELANKSNINHTHELGGTNLIPGTQDMSFENLGVGEEDGEYRGLKVLHTNNTSDRYLDIIKLFYDKNKEYGEYYTLSFWLKGTPKENGANCYFYSDEVMAQVVKSTDGWTKPYGDGECRFNITSEWRRVWVVYQLEADGTLNTPKNIAIRANAGADVYVAGLKFERGDQPSDWSPAPEDNSLKVETISEGIDFNDYKTEGLYNLPWASVNQSTNRPSNTGGRLEVIVFSNGVRQFFYNYGSDNSGLKVYFRNFDGTNDVWMAWHTLADGADISSLNSAITNKVGDIQSALDKIIGV